MIAPVLASSSLWAENVIAYSASVSRITRGDQVRLYQNCHLFSSSTSSATYTTK